MGCIVGNHTRLLTGIRHPALLIGAGLLGVGIAAQWSALSGDATPGSASLLGATTPSVPPATAGTPPESTAAQQMMLAERMGNAPMHFEPAAGEEGANPQRFVSRGQGYSTLVTATGVRVRVSYLDPDAATVDDANSHSPEGEASRTDTREARAFKVTRHRDRIAPQTRKTAELELEIIGANPDAPLTALDPRESYSNYLTGNDPSQWRQNVPHYGKLKVSNVYPGIDLVHYGHGKKLEYDFVVAPGVDPGVIALRFNGAERIELNEQRDLVLSMQGGDLIQQRPVVYQQIDGQRQPVEGSYVIATDDSVQFSLGSYDRSHALVIDPILVNSYHGGEDFDTGRGIAVDGAGNAWITGRTLSDELSFPLTNAADPTFNGSLDVFVAKYNSIGGLVVSTYLGGASDDEGEGIAVDSAGNAWVTGLTDSDELSFPLVNAVDPEFSGFFDAFVAKFDSAGNLVYSTYLGGDGFDAGRGIAVDSDGNAYVTGGTDSDENSFLLNNPADATYNGGFDAFVAKFDSAGGLVYSTYLGGNSSDEGRGIAVDGVGRAWVTGNTSSDQMSFPLLNAADATYNGDTDAFVARFSSAGALLHSTYLGGGEFDAGLGIAVDSVGSAWVTGETSSDEVSFPLVGAADATPNGSRDAFVAKYSSAGVLVYSTYLGGNFFDAGNDVDIDGADNAWVTGETQSNEFGFPLVNAADATFNGNGGDSLCIPNCPLPQDAFVAKYTANGALVYSTYLGGSDLDSGNGIAIDSGGNAWVTGETSSDDLRYPGAAIAVSGLSYSGGGDAFVIKLNDAAPSTIQFSVEEFVVSESGVQAQLRVDRTGSLAGPASVQYQTVALPAAVGSATADADYETASDTLNWNNNDGQPQFIEIQIVPDSETEPSERFQVVLSNPMGASLGTPNVAEVIILDDDQAGELAFDPPTYSITEGDSGTANVTLTVRRTGGSSGEVRVDYATNSTGLRAVAGQDYMATSGQLIFPGGVNLVTQTFPVAVIGDLEDEAEPPETFRVQLSSPTDGATLGEQSAAIVSIIDDDDSPGVIGFNAGSITLNEGNGQVTISVRRTNGTDGAVAASFMTMNGTATAGQDYELRSGLVEFGDGQTSDSITIPITDDMLDEPLPNEFFTVVLSNPSGDATLDSGFSVFTVNLVDNDADVVEPPNAATFQIGDITPNPVLETDGITVVTLTRAGTPNVAAEVFFEFDDGDAVAPQDYVPLTTDSVVFEVGQSSAEVRILIEQDNVVDSSPVETFNIRLTDVAALGPGGTVSRGTPSVATIAIQDVDMTPDPDPDPTPGTLRFSQSDYAVNEGAGEAELIVLRENGADGAVQVSVSLSGGTAMAGGSSPDFNGMSRTVTLADSQTAASVFIPIVSDDRTEATESFTAALSSSTPRVLIGSPASARVDILDDDSAPLPERELENQLGEPITVSVSAGVIAVSSVPASFSANDVIPLSAGGSITVAGVEEQFRFEVSGLAPGQATTITIDLNRTTTAKALLNNLAVLICDLTAAGAVFDCDRVDPGDLTRSGNGQNSINVPAVDNTPIDKDPAVGVVGKAIILGPENFTGGGGGGGGGSPSPALLLIAALTAAWRWRSNRRSASSGLAAAAPRR